MDEKKIKLGKLIPLYIFIYALTAILVLPPHTFPEPYFMFFRFPHYLEMMPQFLGVSWPMTFEIYHYGIYALIAIGIINTLGILFYPKMKKAVVFSSLAGIPLFSLFILFILLQFVKINLPTAFAYGIYSISLLTVDLITLKVFLKQKKEA